MKLASKEPTAQVADAITAFQFVKSFEHNISPSPPTEQFGQLPTRR